MRHDLAPTRLSGRDNELKLLRAAYQRIGSPGRRDVVLLRGPAGIGKTALARALHIDINEQGSLFATGLCAPPEAPVPCQAFAQIAAALLARLAMAPLPAMALWQRRLMEALGPAAAGLTELVPGLVPYLGGAIAPRVMGPRQAGKRLVWLMQSFISTFAQQQPLVVFIDQVQWADPATLDLIQHLAHPSETRGSLLVLLGCRDALTSPPHAPFDTLPGLHVMDLPGLNLTEVQNMVRSMSHGSALASADAVPLHLKSAGNPLFLRALVSALQRHQQLTYNSVSRTISCDLGALAALPDTVAALLAQRLADLDPATQALLGAAACCGISFTLADVDAALGPNSTVDAAQLEPACDACILWRPFDVDPAAASSYTFTHEDVRQIAYASLAATPKRGLHQALAAHVPNTAGGVIACAYHTAAAASPAPQQVEANLAAAQVAARCGSFQTAAAFINAALQQAPTPAPAALQLHLMEYALLAGDGGAATALHEHLLATSADSQARATIYLRWGIAQSSGALYAPALATLRRGLAEQRETIPVGPGPATCMWQLLKTHRAIRRQRHAVAAVPPVVSMPTRHRIDMLVATLQAAAGVNMRLVAVCAARLSQLTLQEGSSPGGAVAYAALTALHAYVNRYAEAQATAAAARASLRRHADAYLANSVSWVLTSHSDHVHSTPQQMAEHYRQTAVPGLFENVPHLSDWGLFGQAMTWSFTSVPTCITTVEAQLQIGRALQSLPLRAALEMLLQFCRCLQGKTATPYSLNHGSYNETALTQTLRSTPTNFLHSAYYTYSMQLQWLHGDIQGACQTAVDGWQRGMVQFATDHQQVHIAFYSSLALVAEAVMGGRRRVRHPGALKTALAKLRAVAAAGPEIYGGLAELADALQAELRGDTANVARGYEACVIRLAHAPYLNMRAAALDCATRFFVRRGLHVAASHFAMQARDAYRMWGATYKADLFEQEHTTLCTPQTATPQIQRPATDAEAVDVPALMQANAALLRIDDAKTEFYANISHELRTPLTLILAPLETLLQSATLPADVREPLHLCKHNALRLLRMVDDLLALTRLESAQVELRISRFNVARFVSGLLDEIRPLAERKRLHVAFEARFPPDLMLDADPIEIERVVLNILANAIKFTPEDGTITVRLEAVDNQVSLVVQDTGIGIPGDALERVFERFYQVDSSATGRRGGTGIGLALCRKIIELHGGRIVAESEAQRGTTIRLWLPRVAITSITERRPETLPVSRNEGSSEWHDAIRHGDAYRLLPVADAAIVADVQVARSGAGEMVLVIEDNGEMRQFIAGLLRDTYEVHTATQGLTGLEAARTLRPDVIVSDVMMPGMSGFDLVRALRADSATCHIPIVLLTARDALEDRIIGQQGGADAHLGKPFSADELRSTLRNLLSKQQAQQTAGRELRHSEMHTMMASISHEILNPLGFIRSAIYLMHELTQEGAAADAFREPFDAANEGVTRIHLVVDELRRLNEGGPLAPLTPTRLDSVVQSLQRLVSHRVTFKAELAATAVVEARPGQIEQVLLNLLMNAQQAAGPGGEINLKSWDDTDASLVFIAVSDNGPGIAAEQQETIFLPFFTTKAEGSGLGLAISRQIIREHGGDLRVDSTPGKGSTFMVTLPALRSAP